MKLSETEIYVMNIIWEREEVPAIEIAQKLAVEKGWKKPTVYTLIDRLIKKGAVKRTDPDYICSALIGKDEVRVKETEGLIAKLYNGSAKLLVSGFIKDKRLTDSELEELRQLIDEVKNERNR